VGSLQPGRLADIVIWSPQFFGVKPKMIIKGGFIAYSLMGDQMRTWVLETHTVLAIQRLKSQREINEN